jgi:transposase
MLAEASMALAERDYSTLRALCGTAPVTRQSGKRKTVTMRYACNQHLRNAVHHWSRNAAMHDARSRDHYAALRARGKSHAHSLRVVADRLIRMLVGALKNGQLFDAARWQPEPAPAAP